MNRLSRSRSMACVAGFLLAQAIPTAGRGEVVWRDGDRSLNLGLWVQGWYQYVEDAADRNGDGRLEEDLHDFLVRRVYLYVQGTATSWLGFFVHLSGDRFGQRGLDNPSDGLGGGLALRDGWASLRLLDGGLNLHAGRMYVPFTRNLGTTSAKMLLRTDFDWAQGGYRGGIFYPSRVGRDDGVALWGNIAGGLLQYRLFAGDGVDDAPRNPSDNLRLAGRLSLSLLDPETAWFNEGTSLGKRRVLSLGGGVDTQELQFDGAGKRYFAWTADLHYDQPLAGGAITLEGSAVVIENVPNPVNFTAIAPGADADILSVQAGFMVPGNLGPGRLQPFASFESLHADPSGHRTNIGGLGFNYFLAGHANKLTAEVTSVVQDGSVATLQDHLLVTVQVAAGL